MNQGQLQDYLNGGTEGDQDIDSQLNSIALSFLCEKMIMQKNLITILFWLIPLQSGKMYLGFFLKVKVLILLNSPHVT